MLIDVSDVPYEEEEFEEELEEELSLVELGGELIAGVDSLGVGAP
ncbi:MAG TPA: hypothetical protein VHO24_08315 [Opitutaceae bacterium]|nr:hypothetical protein [Opitutaceae bacterium]